MTKRDSKGRFAPGNAGGPGRPTRQEEISHELRRLLAISDVVSPDDWRLILEKAKEQALEGDHRSREWLARHLLPDPRAIEEWKDTHDWWLSMSNN